MMRIQELIEVLEVCWRYWGCLRYWRYWRCWRFWRCWRRAMYVISCDRRSACRQWVYAGWRMELGLGVSMEDCYWFFSSLLPFSFPSPLFSLSLSHTPSISQFLHLPHSLSPILSLSLSQSLSQSLPPSFSPFVLPSFSLLHRVASVDEPISQPHRRPERRWNRP